MSSSPPPIASLPRSAAAGKAKAKVRDDPIIVIDSDTEEEDEEDLLQWERDRAAAKRRRGGEYNGAAAAGGERGKDEVIATASGSGSSTAPLAVSSKIVQPLQPAASAPLALATEAPPSTSDAKISPPSLGGLGLGFSASDRKAMEEARRQRQKERRRAQGLKSESEDSEGELDSQNGVVGHKQAYQPQPTSTSSQAGPGNFKSRSYISEVEAARPAAKGKVRGFEDLTRDAEDGGGSSSGSAIGGASALSGLGGVSGSKPALRRILAGDRFWDGTVKRSWSRYTQDGVPFSDLILPTTRSNAAGLTHAVITSYDIDYQWLSTILPTKNAAQPGRKALPGPELTFLTSEKTGLPVGTHAAGPPGWSFNVRKELRKEHSCPHIKLLLLFYPDRLRLGILTGNMIEYDWSTLENAAFLQDFPILPGERMDTSTDVYDQLSMVLSSMVLPRQHAAFRLLARYDLTKGPTIVASLATDVPVKGWDKISKVGLGRLAVKSREIMGGPVVAGGLELEAQGSSMGMYSQRWLQQFHLAASGADLSHCLPLPAAQGAATRRYGAEIGRPGKEWPPIKVVFPTREFVLKESAPGPQNGHCHFGKPDAFHRWKHLCYQARGARLPGMLMHQKAILALKPGFSNSTSSAASASSSSSFFGRGNTTGQSTTGQSTSVDTSAAAADAEPNAIIGWTYLGSANFTMAAWGNLALLANNERVHGSSSSSNGAGSGEVGLTANNWELGVLLPFRRRDLESEAELSSNARSAICWERPLRAYRSAGIAGPEGGAGEGEEGDVPWLSEENQQRPSTRPARR